MFLKIFFFAISEGSIWKLDYIEPKRDDVMHVEGWENYRIGSFMTSESSTNGVDIRHVAWITGRKCVKIVVGGEYLESVRLD
jgi:hypothetical protein